MTDSQILALQPAHLAELQQRYQRVLADKGYSALLISAGAAPMRYGDDQGAPFHGFGPFLHWTGLTGYEHAWLLIQTDATPILWLYQPVDFWHATLQLPSEPWQQAMDIRYNVQRGLPPLPAQSRQGEGLAVVGDPALLAGVPGDHNPAALTAALDETRMHKTDYEVACLARANNVALAGHRAAAAAFADGASEFAINLAYQQATLQRETEAPYHSIIGLNEHAGTLHYQYYDTTAPAQSRSLLIDAGVRYRGYCSDITRTYAAAGEGRFAALIKGLDLLRERLCKMVAPGVEYLAIHRKAHAGVAALLSASRLVRGISDEAMVEQGITQVFFPHGIGHFLGIQVHDVAGKPTPSPAEAPFLRLTRTLEAGMVVTIEPGLYFIPSLLEPLLEGPLAQHINIAILDELKGCGGVRLEDNVLVTQAGAQNLSRLADH